MSSDVEVRFYSSINCEEVEWLWYPYIPYGKLTVLQGDPGEGKSTLIVNIAARLTVGKTMPDGYKSHGPHKVIYQCAEDSVADTIKPRLLSAGADCDMVAFVFDDDSPLTLDDERIEYGIRQTEARLFILDPIQAFLPQDGDMQSAQRMRSVLRKLAAVAAKTRCAVVLVGHMNKTTAGKNLYRGLGSIDIAAIARSVLMIERDSHDPTVRYMFPVKTSLAPEDPAIAFTLNQNGFQWLGPCEHRFEAELSESNNKRSRAAHILLQLLADGELESREIFQLMEQEDISRRTVQAAKKDLDLEAFRKNGAWYWRKPTVSAYCLERGSHNG